MAQVCLKVGILGGTQQENSRPNPFEGIRGEARTQLHPNIFDFPLPRTFDYKKRFNQWGSFATDIALIYQIRIV